MAGDGGNRGACRDADGEPFCGALETHEEGSAARYRDGRVSFVLEGGGTRFFVGEILLQGVGLDGAGAAVLEIVVEGDEVGLGN